MKNLSHFGQNHNEEGIAPCFCGLVQINIAVTPGSKFDLSTIPAKHRQYIEDVNADEAGWVYLTTGCTRSTKKNFAPGHDATLKGILQTAVALGADASTVDGGMSLSMDPMRLAENFGFEAQVAAAIGRTPKAKRTSTRKPGKEIKATSRAKVGRWEYEGNLDAEGTFHYISKTGKTVPAFAGSYTLIGA